MSLINKMLRDLDARRVGDSERAAFPAAVTPLAAHQEPRRGASLLWLVVVMLAALGIVAWYSAREMPKEPPVAPKPAVRSLPAAAPAPAAPAAPVAPLAPATQSVARAAEPAAEPAAGANAGLPALRLADRLWAVPAPAAEPPRRVATSAPKTPERPAAAAPSRRPPAALPRAPTVPAEGRIDKQTRRAPAAERAELEYQRGVLAQRQGKADEAVGNYLAALEEFPEHAAARQTLAALLIDAKRYDEAEAILRQGTELAPVRLASTLAWARLKVERHQAPAALDLLLKHAASGERSAEYQGFVGALLNRAGRAPEAAEHYQAATRLAPSEARWWAGLGIALDAAGKPAEARQAYQHARGLPGLPADLAQHVEQRLR